MFVDGVQLMEDGKAQLVDEHKVLKEGEEMARRSLERAGFHHFIDQEPSWGQIRKYETREKFSLERQRKEGGYY